MPPSNPHIHDNVADRKTTFLVDDITFSADSLRKELASGLEFEQTWTDSAARLLAKSFGTVWFLGLCLSGMLLWVVLNLGLIFTTPPYDPYPFSLLSLCISIFGILLSIVLLINQNRQGRIAEVRQRIDFEINVRAETEITKILNMLDELHNELGISKADSELEKMKEKIDIAGIREEIEQIIDDEEGASKAPEGAN